MDLKTAKQILKPLEGTSELMAEFTAARLHHMGWYLHAKAGDARATLDGDFTADELEAVAAWMRDPQGVVNA